ncbi:hypothetical protein [Nocardia carnea]|uniref:Uncharacterized protein n=1 Tax=Nocardia carnea TaxID=37328 RepID=A0ABW7TKM6_9NOCA|nr:hypothetical protein [Nocardia carnea]
MLAGTQPVHSTNACCARIPELISAQSSGAVLRRAERFLVQRMARAREPEAAGDVMARTGNVLA